MWITEFRDYKKFLRAHMKTFPKAGRGQSQRLAESLNIAPIGVSHVLSRDKHFTPDQAVKIAIYYGFDKRTTEYFLCMVHLARANSNELRTHYQQRLTELREEAEQVKNLIKDRTDLSDENKGIFYSNWYYSAVRLLTSIKGYQTVDAIAEYFDLSRTKVSTIVSFLVKTGLCVEEQGKIRMGSKWTHVDSQSPFVNGHRRNWRTKAQEKFSEHGPRDLFYSSPTSLSKKDAEEFRKHLLELIRDYSKRVETSPEETLMCLNIDWFEF